MVLNAIPSVGFRDDIFFTNDVCVHSTFRIVCSAFIRKGMERLKILRYQSIHRSGFIDIKLDCDFMVIIDWTQGLILILVYFVILVISLDAVSNVTPVRKKLKKSTIWGKNTIFIYCKFTIQYLYSVNLNLSFLKYTVTPLINFFKKLFSGAISLLIS